MNSTGMAAMGGDKGETESRRGVLDLERAGERRAPALPFFLRESLAILFVVGGVAWTVCGPQALAEDSGPQRAAPEAASASEGSPKAGQLGDVVIKGGGDQVSIPKPPLDIPVDPAETIRDSLKREEHLFMAESPAAAWARSHPEALKDKRVIQPWRIEVQEAPRIRLSPLKALSKALRRSLSPKEAKDFQWRLTIADEAGQAFRKFEGKGEVSEEIVWDGRNEAGEPVEPGRFYSALYLFLGPDRSVHTAVGELVQLHGTVHRGKEGLKIGLDPAVLFGRERKARELVLPEGRDLVMDAVDWIKRRHGGAVVGVRSVARTASLAQAQAKGVQGVLSEELKLLAKDIRVESRAFSGQERGERLEIFLLNP